MPASAAPTQAQTHDAATHTRAISVHFRNAMYAPSTLQLLTPPPAPTPSFSCWLPHRSSRLFCLQALTASPSGVTHSWICLAPCRRRRHPLLGSFLLGSLDHRCAWRACIVRCTRRMPSCVHGGVRGDASGGQRVVRPRRRRVAPLPRLPVGTGGKLGPASGARVLLGQPDAQALPVKDV